MKYKLLLFFLLFSSICIAQEICNNGIDDDGDGKIDLNDSDCICNKTDKPNHESFPKNNHLYLSNATLDVDDFSTLLHAKWTYSPDREHKR